MDFYGVLQVQLIRWKEHIMQMEKALEYGMHLLKGI